MKSVKCFLLIFILIIGSFVDGLKFHGILQDLVDQNLEQFNISTKCVQHMILIRNGLQDREIWALKLLDASSHIGPDFVWGNNILIGSPRSCSLVGDPANVKFASDHVPIGIINLTQIKAPIPVIYRTIHARHWSQMQVDLNALEKNVLNFGFCLPLSCDSSDSRKIVEEILQNKNFTERSLIGMDTEVIHTKVLQVRDNFDQSGSVKAFFTIFYVISFLIVLELLFRSFRKIHEILQPKNDEDENDLKKKEIIKPSFVEKFLACFSIIENTKIIASKEIASDSIEVLHGLRVMGMVLFITGHVFLFAISSVTNLQHIFIYAENVWLQPLFTIHLTLDTFFVLSGMVLSYIFFQNQKNKDIKNYPSYYFRMVMNRFLRLTPPYMISMLLAIVVTKLVKDLSPYYLLDDDEVKCEKNWWRNILYINNLYPVKEMCMIWSWYLGADFQCFLISGLLILVLKKNERLGKILFAAAFLLATSITGYFGYKMGFVFSQDCLYKTADYLYTPFWGRLGAYFAGVFAGRFLSCNNRTLNLSRKWITLGWTIAPLMNLLILFGHGQNVISPITAMFYTALARTAWGVGIAWIIIACSTGHGGIVNRILSAKFFLPFSRMTYSAYLVNPIWIMFITMLNEAPYHLDFPMLFITSMGFMTTVYAVAFIFMLLFENPFIRLTKLLTS